MYWAKFLLFYFMIIKESYTGCNFWGFFIVKSAIEQFPSWFFAENMMEKQKFQSDLPKQDRACPEVKCMNK